MSFNLRLASCWLLETCVSFVVVRSRVLASPLQLEQMPPSIIGAMLRAAADIGVAPGLRRKNRRLAKREGRRELVKFVPQLGLEVAMEFAFGTPKRELIYITIRLRSWPD